MESMLINKEKNMEQLIKEINDRDYVIDLEQNADFTWDLNLYKNYDFRFEKVIKESPLIDGLKEMLEFVKEETETEE